MHNITLLSSFHLELGKCNSNELYKIIEKIQPEIIFEELPDDIFDIIYAENSDPRSLEARTIKRYLKQYRIEHFPVDTGVKNEFEFFNGFDIISRRSVEYTELCNRQASMIYQYGYSFLNSSNAIELLDKMHVMEESVLLEINNEKLSNQYKSDKKLQDKRECEMLQNIYNYSEQFQFNQAMFICGGEHRKPLLQKIKEYEEKEGLKLNWTFYNC